MYVRKEMSKIYKKAKQNNIKNLVGYDIKFDNPKNYDLKINTTKKKADCINKLFTFLKKKKILINK